MCMQKVKKVFLTEMDDGEAREFLLYKESYVAPNYPKYYNFMYLIEYGKALLGRRTFDDVNGLVIDRNYGYIPDVNYTIQFNKSKDSFRPNVIMHPLLYVDLVNLLTDAQHWQGLLARYHELDAQAGPHIVCNSIPFDIKGDKNKTKYALHFWKSTEQESIKLRMSYKYILQLDLTNFYGTIDTQTIAWALHGETEVKANRRDQALLGNRISERLKAMNYGSTIGIPQATKCRTF